MTRIAALFMLTLVASCGQVELPNAAIRPAAAPSPSTFEIGRALYNYRCYFCHGYSGDAKTVAAQYLSPRPRDFTDANAVGLTTDAIAQAVAHGREGTAMKGFKGILKDQEIRAVAEFVRQEFIVRRATNTRYHTEANGWPDHDRYRAAFPFATGELALDTAAEALSENQRLGLRLFMGACVSCHDQTPKTDAPARWELRAVSYPPNASSCLSCHNRDGARLPGHDIANRSMTYAGRAKPRDANDPHELHDRVPRFSTLTEQQQRGERLYQSNCAFCHAADGSGRNWIGSFIEPHPANFTDGRFMTAMSRERIHRAITEGVEGTSMPAWKTVLESDQIEAIISYIERAFHPIGSTQEKINSQSQAGS